MINKTKSNFTLGPPRPYSSKSSTYNKVNYHYDNEVNSPKMKFINKFHYSLVIFTLIFILLLMYLFSFSLVLFLLQISYISFIGFYIIRNLYYTFIEFKIEHPYLYKIFCRFIFFLLLTILITYLFILFSHISFSDTYIESTEISIKNKHFLAWAPLESTPENLPKILEDLKKLFTTELNFFNTKKVELFSEVDKLKDYCSNNIQCIVYSYSTDSIVTHVNDELTNQEMNTVRANLNQNSKTIRENAGFLLKKLALIEAIDGEIHYYTNDRINSIEFYRTHESELYKYERRLPLLKDCTRLAIRP